MLTMRQRQAVTATLRYRYRKSEKKVKSQILDEFVETTGYNRSYARRVLGSKKQVGRKRKRSYTPRNRKYDADVFYALRQIWIAADCICGQRLQPFMAEMMAKLEQFEEIDLDGEVKDKLLTMSSATIDRMLSTTKKRQQLKGKGTTKPGTLLKHSIPMRTFADWDEQRPGFFEVDLVAFCGETAKGEYVNGLNLTDIHTGWVLLDAVMGKGQHRVHLAIDEAQDRCPFSILGLDPDNGSEFINWILKRYCDHHQITFTRIRPGKKNDNCYVEQKNYTTLRRFVGYARFETGKQYGLIKQMLQLVEDYVNFFQPSLKLKSKTRIGARVKKRYHQAKTPYQRLLQSKVLNTKQAQQIAKYYESLNPMELRRQIYKLQIKLEKTLRYKNS